jgi:hypothetical protein
MANISTGAMRLILGTLLTLSGTGMLIYRWDEEQGDLLGGIGMILLFFGIGALLLYIGERIFRSILSIFPKRRCKSSKAVRSNSGRDTSKRLINFFK